MPVKRRVSKARAQLSELAYKFLTDAPLSEDEKADFEFFMLDCNQFDILINADTETLWERHSPEIPKEWVARNPGTRPICWWRYSSGLEHKQHERGWELSIEESIPEDQSVWLKEHGFD